MTSPELNDIQGIVLRSYGTKRHARFFFLSVTDAKKAGKWLAEIAGKITTVSDKGHKRFLNIAFTREGLSALKMPDSVISTFSPEFKEGPLDPHRLRMLGDVYKNAPESWEWGNNQSCDQCHILLLTYAENIEDLEAFDKELEAAYSVSGLKKAFTFNTNLLDKNKEHFGFRDGISQPSVQGFGKDNSNDPYAVKTGEFILGYENEYDRIPESPEVDPVIDRQNVLPAGGGKKDLGRNGSYLVFRQISQDVKGFWDFVQQGSCQNPHGPAADKKFLAAKMIGRWPGGAPVTLSPDNDDPGMETVNNFGYHSSDREGLKCPVGSHIRRTNPRDAFMEDEEKSIAFSRKHRIIRRSRTYGKPLVSSMDPEEVMKHPGDDEKRGIFFLSFNASISRQFEFIQQSWVVNPQFRDLYQDPDPFTGNQEMEKDGIPGFFTMPCAPVREKVEGVKSFVHVKGSSYLFTPGLRALKFIADTACNG